MSLDRVGIGPRALAIIIDTVLIFIVSCCVGFVIGIVASSASDFGSPLSIVLNLISTVAVFAYYIILEGRSGQTLGKKLIKIKVVREDGTPITMNEAVIRNLLRIVDGFPYIIPYLTGMIIMSTNPNKQRLGDKVAKTIVVSAGTTSQEPQTADPPLPRF